MLFCIFSYTNIVSQSVYYFMAFHKIPPKKSIQSLSADEKKELAKVTFPKLETSEIELACKDIIQCFTQGAGEDYKLTFAQYLRGVQWLKDHNYKVPENMPVAIAEN